MERNRRAAELVINNQGGFDTLVSGLGNARQEWCRNWYNLE